MDYGIKQAKDILTLAINHAKKQEDCAKKNVGCYIIKEGEKRTVAAKGYEREGIHAEKDAFCKLRYDLSKLSLFITRAPLKLYEKEIIGRISLIVYGGEREIEDGFLKKLKENQIEVVHLCDWRE